MSCQRISPELVAYQFGDVPTDTRDAIEAHLLGCPECLADFLAIKREIEAPSSSEQPSPQARARLRRAVLAELRAEPAARPWSWWERPLAFGFAGAMVLAATVAVRMLSASPGAPPRTLLLEPSPAHGGPAEIR